MNQDPLSAWLEMIAMDLARYVLVAGAAFLVFSNAPCEYYHYMVKGLARDPSQRYASVEEMERVLEAILDGKPPINCHITLTKRVGAGALHWMERHKVAFTVLFLAAVGAAIWSVVRIVQGLVGGA